MYRMCVRPVPFNLDIENPPEKVMTSIFFRIDAAFLILRIYISEKAEIRSRARHSNSDF